MRTRVTVLAVSLGVSCLVVAVTTVLGQDQGAAPRDFARELRLATSRDTRLDLIGRITSTRTRSAEIARALGEVLAEDDPSVAIHAAEALAVQEEFAWPVLAEALVHESAFVKMQAMRASGMTARMPAAVLSRLGEILQDSGQELAVRMAASNTLATRGAECLDIVRPLLLRSDPVTRALALDAMRLTGVKSQRLAEIVSEAARDRSPRVRIAAARCLDAWGVDAKAILAVVVPLLDDADQHVRYDALEVLEIMGERAAPAVNRLASYVLTTKEDGERLVAVVILRKIGTKDTLRPMLSVLNEPSERDSPNDRTTRLLRHRMREEALAALQRLGASAEESVPLLVSILNDKQQEVWWHRVVEVLAAIGPPARVAVPTLERLAAGEPNWLGKTCKDAIARIQGK